MLESCLLALVLMSNVPVTVGTELNIEMEVGLRWIKK
jgi:hypothetical protein